MYTCRGTVIYISDEQVINDTLSKKVLAIQTEEDDRPQYLSFELFNNNMQMAEQFKLEDRVSVTFFIRGTKSDKAGGPYFYNSLRPTKISKSKKPKEEESEINE